MLLKRYIPLFIVIVVGVLTLFGPFINNAGIQNFVENDATQWFDIIASFAIFLGALNMLKLQLLRIIRKNKNWQYSILAIFGFAFAIFAGFFYRGANYITLEKIDMENISIISQIIADEIGTVNPEIIENKIILSEGKFEINKIYKTQGAAGTLIEKLNPYAENIELSAKRWGKHVQIPDSLFYWMYFNIYTPLSASMFALLAFFVASASYRAFRIRNFEATLLLVAGIILMLGRVPVGALIPWWVVIVVFVFGIGAVLAPRIKDRKLLFGLVTGGIILFITIGLFMGWNQNPPALLSIPAIQEWIFNYPTTAGSRALMIGIALGIVGTSFRIILGIERSFLGG